MGTTRPPDRVPADAAFPFARRGYDRSAVDAYALQTQSRIVELRQHHEALARENQQLRDALAQAQDRARSVDFAGLGGRAQEILRVAEEQARDVTQRAAQEADRILGRAQKQAATIDERARQEFAWRRRQMRHEQDLLTRRKEAMLSRLTSLSALAVETADNLTEVPELSLDDFDEAGPLADAGPS